MRIKGDVGHESDRGLREKSIAAAGQGRVTARDYLDSAKGDWRITL